MVTNEPGLQVRGPLWGADSAAARQVEAEYRRRRELVDAAVKLFIETGYHETTTRDIATG